MLRGVCGWEGLGRRHWPRPMWLKYVPMPVGHVASPSQAPSTHPCGVGGREGFIGFMELIGGVSQGTHRGGGNSRGFWGASRHQLEGGAGGGGQAGNPQSGRAEQAPPSRTRCAGGAFTLAPGSADINLGENLASCPAQPPRPWLASPIRLCLSWAREPSCPHKPWHGVEEPPCAPMLVLAGENPGVWAPRAPPLTPQPHSPPTQASPPPTPT